MTREEVKLEFAGFTHDHLMVNKQDFVHHNQPTINNRNIINNKNNGQTCPQLNNEYVDSNNSTAASALSTIAILRRHPMYDSLVLVKRYRACLNGHTLEFPTSETTTTLAIDVDGERNLTKQEQDCCKTKLVSVYLDGDDPIYQCQERENRKEKSGLNSPGGEIIHVPMNGLLDRLDNYDRQGISIDSRVYAFAIGLKTAEQFLTRSSMKEIQETPPL